MSNDLEKLQKIWYQKLKDEGFKDIEDPEGPRDGGRGAPRVDNLDEIQMQAIREYYTMARHFLVEFKFKNLIDRLVWEDYSEGVPVRTISVNLKAKGHIKAKSSIWQRIKKLEKLMYLHYAENHEPK